MCAGRPGAGLPPFSSTTETARNLRVGRLHVQKTSDCQYEGTRGGRVLGLRRTCKGRRRGGDVSQGIAGSASRVDVVPPFVPLQSLPLAFPTSSLPSRHN